MGGGIFGNIAEQTSDLRKIDVVFDEKSSTDLALKMGGSIGGFILLALIIALTYYNLIDKDE